MKFPTLVPVALRYVRPLILIPAGSTLSIANPASEQSPHPISGATQILESTGHSRTLYTSNAADQSNIIYYLKAKNRHSPKAGRAGGGQ
jgi:hypothetical protein